MFSVRRSVHGFALHRATIYGLPEPGELGCLDRNGEGTNGTLSQTAPRLRASSTSKAPLRRGIRELCTAQM